MFAAVGCGFKMYDVLGQESECGGGGVVMMQASLSLLRGCGRSPEASGVSHLCPPLATHLSYLPSGQVSISMGSLLSLLLLSLTITIERSNNVV